MESQEFEATQETFVNSPEISGADDDVLGYVWGRVWFTGESQGFGFYVALNAREGKVNNFDLLNRDEKEELEELHPYQTLDSFKRSLRSETTLEDKHRASYQQLRDDFETSLGHQDFNEISDWLKEQEDEPLDEWVRNFLRELPGTGDILFQIAGKAVSLENMIRTPSEDEKTVESQEGEKIEIERYLRIEPETSIQGGTLGKDLREGDHILYRVTGRSVNYLEDALVEQNEEDPQSVLFRAGVILVIVPSALPDHLDGRAENHRQVFVQITPEVIGVGYFHENDQIQNDWDVSVDVFSVENIVTYSLITVVSLMTAAIILLMIL